MDRDSIGVRDGINRTPSEYDSISFSKTPSRRSILFQRFRSIFRHNVSQMTPAVTRWSMPTTSSDPDYETASEAMSDTDSDDNNPFQSPRRTREDLSRFQNPTTDQVGPIPDTGVNISQDFAPPIFENPSPTIQSSFPPQGSEKRRKPQDRLFTDHCYYEEERENLAYDTADKALFPEINWERDFVPSPYSGDQNSSPNSSESIEDTFPAQRSWGLNFSRAQRRQRRQLQDYRERERDWEQSEEVDENISPYWCRDEHQSLNIYGAKGV